MAAATAPRPIRPWVPVASPPSNRTAQVPARTTVGANIRRRRPAIQSCGRPDPLRTWASSDMAEAKPPTTKNRGITWNTQVIHDSDGSSPRALPAVMSPLASVDTAMADQ